MDDDVRVTIRARISMLSAHDGGRESPIVGGSSYRPNHNFGEPDGRMMCIGEINLPAGTNADPGDMFETNIELFIWPELRSTIERGLVWRIQEGPKLVAWGQVLEVLD